MRVARVPFATIALAALILAATGCDSGGPRGGRRAGSTASAFAGSQAKPIVEAIGNERNTVVINPNDLAAPPVVKPVDMDAIAAAPSEDDLVGIRTFAAIRQELDTPEKLQAHEQKIREQLEALSEQPGDNFAKLGSLLNEQAAMLFMQNDLVPADSASKQAVDTLHKAFGPSDLRVAHAIYNRAEIFLERKEYLDAEALIEQVQTIYERTQGFDSPEVAQLSMMLGSIALKRKAYTLAELRYDRALRIWEMSDRGIRPVIETLRALGAATYEAKHYRQSAAAFQRLVAALEQVEGPESPELISPMNNLGVVYRYLGDNRRAEEVFRRLLTLREKINGPDDPEIYETYYHLAQALMAQDRNAEAEPIFLKVLAMHEEKFGPDSLDVAGTLLNVGKFYINQRRADAAAPYLERAKKIAEANLPENHIDLVSVLEPYALMLRFSGQQEACKEMIQQIIAIKQANPGVEPMLGSGQRYRRTTERRKLDTES